MIERQKVRNMLDLHGAACCWFSAVLDQETAYTFEVGDNSVDGAILVFTGSGTRIY